MKLGVLIVSNAKAERELLTEMLNEIYEVSPVSNAEEALSVIDSDKAISTVLIDTANADLGLEVLCEIYKHENAAGIPALLAVPTFDSKAQTKALTLGSVRFILKPYTPELLKTFLQNSTSLNEIGAYSGIIYYDKLTGLFSREAFFIEAKKMIKRHEAGYYVMACFDVDHFRVINDQYGTENGDETLRHIAGCIEKCASQIDGIVCRFSSDRFAMLYPATYENSDIILAAHEKIKEPPCLNRKIKLRIGRYIVDDCTLSVGAMFDRATLAERSIKDKYGESIADYDESMRTRLLHEQQIVNAMNTALQNGQFETWYQPQYNHITGAIIGAEALVRWRKDNVLISPAEFIPVFERNGFVYELDKFMWEKVCIYLRKCIDDGKDVLPVSVNISRYDFFAADLAVVFKDLITKYEISAELLRLEITESALAKSSDKIVTSVNNLVAIGFTVEIDDFGSGYSSLNTLKDVPATILKLDMQFLKNNELSTRGGNIIEAVVRMAKWLGMSVIAEGVETKEQADYLTTIGCFYIQGYYYAKPMPESEYDKLQNDNTLDSRLGKLTTVATYDNNSFWDPKSIETLIFNSYVGGACVIEYHNGKTELIRENDRYKQEFAGSTISGVSVAEIDPEDCLDDTNKRVMLNNIEKAIKTRKECTCELKVSGLDNKSMLFLRCTVRVIANTEDRYLLYCVVFNISEIIVAKEKERIAEIKRQEVALQMQAIMANVNGGVSAVTFDKDGNVTFAFVNDKFYEMYGYTKQQAENEKLDVLSLIIPEDRERVLTDIKEKLLRDRQPAVIEYRCFKRGSKDVVYVRCNATLTNVKGIGDDVIISVITDITEQYLLIQKDIRYKDRLSAIMSYVGCGITAVVLKEKQAEFLFANDRYYSLFGYTKDEYNNAVSKDTLAIVYSEDREEVRKKVREVSSKRTDASLEYRVVKKNGEIIWVKTLITIGSFFDIEDPVELAIYTDITAEKQNKDELTFLNETANNLLAQPDAENGIMQTLSKFLTYFKAERVYVFEFNYESNTATNTYEVCADGVKNEKDNFKNVPLSNMSEWINAFEKQNYIATDNVCEPDGNAVSMLSIMKQRSVKSLLAVPLRRDGKLLGFVGADNSYLKSSQAMHFTALGDYITVLLTNRDMYIRLNDENNEMNAIVNGIPGGFVHILLEPNGDFIPLYHSEAFKKLVKLDEKSFDDIYRNDAFGGIHPEDLKLVKDAALELKNKQEVSNIKYRLLCGDGSYVWVIVFGKLRTSETGETFVNLFYTDATDINRLDEQRRELLDNIPCGAGIYEMTSRGLAATYINKRYRSYFKREIGDLSNAPVFEVVYPDDVPRLKAEINAAIAENREGVCDVRIMNGEDGYIPFRITGNVVERGGNKVKIFVTYQMISNETMSIQEMLPIALSKMMSSSGDMTFVKDKSFRYICCSRSCAVYMGCEDENSIVGKTDYEVFDKAIADNYRKIDEVVITEGEPVIDRDEILSSETGVYRYGKVSKYPLKDSHGNIVGIYGVCRDVTRERKNESQLKLLTESIPGGLASFEVGKENIRILYYNEGFFKFSGYTKEEYAKAIENNPFELVYTEDLKNLIVFFDAIRSRKSNVHTCTYRCRTKDGGYRWLSATARTTERHGGLLIVYLVQYDITDSKEYEEKLRLSEEEYHLAIKHSSTVISRYYVESKDLVMSPNAAEKNDLIEIEHNIPYANIESGNISKDTAAAYLEFYESIARGEKEGVARFQKIMSCGWRWIEAHFSTIFNNVGKPVSAVISFRDITDECDKEAIYRKWQQSLKNRPDNSYTLFRCNLSKDVSFDSVEGSLLTVKFTNPETTTFDGRTREYAQEYVFEDDRQRYISTMNADVLISNHYRGKRIETFEYRERVSENSVRWLRRTIETVEYPNSKNVMVYIMFENIDTDKRVELREKILTDTDALTGLLNRKAFTEEVTNRIAERKNDSLDAVFMIDIDGFKSINDNCGHQVGDETLTDVGKKLRSIFRSYDLVCRLGGDEFMVYLCNIPNRTIVDLKAKGICALMRQHINADIKISASVGIAVVPDDGNSFEELYHKADVALYHVKKNGKDNFSFFKDSMEDSTFTV